MMRVSPTILAAGAVLLAPQPADAATLQALAPCYRSVDEQHREAVPVRADGFTPGQRVNVFVDGQLVKQDVVVLPEGQVDGEVSAPFLAQGERAFTLTVTQVDQPSNTATASSRVTALSLRMKPRSTQPNRRVRILGSGFIGETAYGHYLRKGKLRKTISLGTPQGPCGRIDVRRRQIPVKKPALGRWTLQVDNQKAYSPSPAGVFMTLFIRVTENVRGTRPPRR